MEELKARRVLKVTEEDEKVGLGVSERWLEATSLCQCRAYRRSICKPRSRFVSDGEREVHRWLKFQKRRRKVSQAMFLLFLPRLRTSHNSP